MININDENKQGNVRDGDKQGNEVVISQTIL